MRSKIKNGDRPVRSTRPPGVPRPRGNPFMRGADFTGAKVVNCDFDGARLAGTVGLKRRFSRNPKKRAQRR